MESICKFKRRFGCHFDDWIWKCSSFGCPRKFDKTRVILWHFWVCNVFWLWEMRWRTKNTLMLTYFPQFDDNFDALSEMMFLVDRSGSMSGSRIAQAKRALQFFFRSIPENTRFNGNISITFHIFFFTILSLLHCISIFFFVHFVHFFSFLFFLYYSFYIVFLTLKTSFSFSIQFWKYFFTAF